MTLENAQIIVKAAEELGLEVELHHSLVAVEILKVRRMAPTHDVLPHRFRRLDAYHVRAPIGEVPHAGGTGARERQVENHYACQR